MRQITIILLLISINFVLFAQSRIKDISKCVISYNGDSTLLIEKYEIDIKKEKVFYITPIINYLDIKGEKYRTPIKINKHNWIEIHKIIESLYSLTLNQNDSLTNNKITYSIDFYDTKSYLYNNKNVPNDLSRLFEIIRNRNLKKIFKQDDSLFSMLIGEWGIFCFEKKYIGDSNASIINCNVCPKIRFNSDKTAKLILPSGDIENVSWSIKSEILIIINLSNGTDSKFFPTNRYSIELHDKVEYKELKLTINEEKYSYTSILRK